MAKSNFIKSIVHSIRSRISLFIEHLRLYSYRNGIVPSHADFSKFIILTRSRSGSNMLVSYLDSHPNVYVKGEILNKRRGKRICVYLDRFFTLQDKRILASGFKIFYYHPLDDQSGEVWNKLLKMNDLKIIHLRRENLFKVVVSREIAGMTDTWSSVQSQSDLGFQEVKLDPRACEKAFNETREWEADFRKKFSDHDMIEIVYEEFIKDPVVYLERIQKFLNLPSLVLTTKLEKQQKKSLQETVSNYEEIKDYFKNTKWVSFFK